MRQYRANKRQEGGQPPPAPRSTNPGLVAAQWAESTLIVPTGPLRGQPFRLAAWQREFLADALAPGIRESGLSVSRKNGKSGLIAALLLAYLCGPLNGPYWRGIVVSLTGGLAAELRDAIEQCAEMSGLAQHLKIRKAPPPGQIDGLDGARLQILASDKATGHAIAADLAVIDEAGLIQESQRELWGAVFSSVSGRNGRLLAISIRGDGPMFSELAERAADTSVVWHEFAAPENADLDDRSAWHKANPGLADGIKSLEYMVDASRKAIAIPSDASSFRAYDLNQPRNPSTETICSAADLLACEREELPPRTGPCAVGFDVGGSSSLTALAAFWPSTGRLECWAAVGDIPSLIDRGRADGVGGLYEQMERRGELQTYPGRVTPAAEFLSDCAARLGDSLVVVAGADRYKHADTLGWLETSGINWPMEWRGVGHGPDGGHDVRAFQRAVLGGGLVVSESLLLRHAVSESVIHRDANGNPSLDKRRQRGRIDALSAATIACGLGELVSHQPTVSARYRGRNRERVHG